MGRMGAPGGPTFKKVMIDKGKRPMECVRITGSDSTGKKTNENGTTMVNLPPNQPKIIKMV